MIWFLLRRIGSGLLVLLVVLFLLMAMLAVSPIDPSAMFINPDFPANIQDQVRENMGLQDGTLMFCLNWFWNAIQLDLGVSLKNGTSVAEMLFRALPNTVLLSVCALILIFTIGSLIGMLQAVRQYTKTDLVVTLLSLVVYSAPSFWLALMLVLLASALTGQSWPVSGMVSSVIQLKDSAIQSAIEAGVEPTVTVSLWERLVDLGRHMLLPVLALGIPSAAGIARYMRSSMLEVIRQDYVRTARAKGLAARTVLFKHALRNAMIPIITLLGLYLPFLISGAVLVEYVFSWPGMGRLIVTAALTNDYPVIMATATMLTCMVILGNLLADLMYSVIDPRISHG